MGMIKDLWYISILVVISMMIYLPSTISQVSSTSLDYIEAREGQMEFAVNAVRANGCHCGRQYYPPVAPVSWHDQLKQSSQDYAIEMHQYNRFGHNGIDGSVVGDRVDRAGYFWQYTGENIAEGYGTFSEVFHAWLESPSHCKLIMDGRMVDFAISKYGTYWTLHMGKSMPPGTRRSNVRYR